MAFSRRAYNAQRTQATEDFVAKMKEIAPDEVEAYLERMRQIDLDETGARLAYIDTKYPGPKIWL